MMNKIMPAMMVQMARFSAPYFGVDAVKDADERAGRPADGNRCRPAPKSKSPR